jgi:hypothetical protein
MLGIFKQFGVSVFYTCFMLYENFSEIWEMPMFVICPFVS